MRRFCSIILTGSALLLGGCEAVAIGVATPMVIQQKHVNLLNASYAAVDILSQQTEKRFSKDRPLVMENLQEILDMNQKKVIANPKLGRVMTQQMRDRFIQLGYNLVDHTASSGAEVSGTYEIVNSQMNVSLRMKDAKTGRVIGIYDYTLPLSYEIKKHMSGNANMLPPLL